MTKKITEKLNCTVSWWYYVISKALDPILIENNSRNNFFRGNVSDMFIQVI